jgi:hypothetical protein
MLVRSKADPTIIAFITGSRTGVKIKASDTPYEGEYGPGYEFTYAPHLWDVCPPTDLEAFKHLQSYLRS